uniref:Uncharacterized protein n=1 Tax=Populus trichocarpa TaxID=3694 RepID=A0A2K1XE40_POPTR
MLQAQKVRLTDYLDERSAYLTQFAEEANADENHDRLKEITKWFCSAILVEIEKNDNKVADIEGQMEKDRYEGMFFKNLGQKAPENHLPSFNGRLGIAIANSFISSSPDWRKVVFLGAILAGLINQLSYEQRLTLDIERVEKEQTDREK